MPDQGRGKSSRSVFRMTMIEGTKDGIEITKKKFVGRPLARLYKRHGASRNRFALFLEDDNTRTPLGADYNLSLIIYKNWQYADFPVKDIVRYYNEIHVIITRPEEEKDAGS